MNVNSNGRSLTVQNQTQNQLYNLRLRELLPLGRLSIPSGMQVGVRVEKDGSLSAIKVLNGIGAACDGEVVKVVKKMPKWKPGKRNGLPVRVILKMPIRFENAI